MRVRPFRPADAPALAALFHQAVRIGGRGYFARQRAAWSPVAADPADYHRRAAANLLLVAADAADRPIGYGDLHPDGLIDHLYCAPDRSGRGIGGMMLAALTAAAAAADLRWLLVDASEGARPFFARHGFTWEARQDFALDGVAIHNHRMRKRLSATAPADGDRRG